MTDDVYSAMSKAALENECRRLADMLKAEVRMTRELSKRLDERANPPYVLKSDQDRHAEFMCAALVAMESEFKGITYEEVSGAAVAMADAMLTAWRARFKAEG